jgi:hypothetical protein
MQNHISSLTSLVGPYDWWDLLALGVIILIVYIIKRITDWRAKNKASRDKTSY